ncbi:MAG: LacI family DNA-binding transcriptional regulator [Halanaerobiales bacterium]|nr:LacI family DNA-binding transcriptional regulator [Halanaerobiales bacterium]
MSSTIMGVAKLAGVSVGTVSNVINNKVNVLPHTRKKVLDAIEELNFQPSESARVLKRGKTNTIALLIPEISRPFYYMLIEGIESAASKNGYDLILYKTHRKPSVEAKWLQLLGEKKVDGVILVSIVVDDKALDIVVEKKYPVVLLEKHEVIPSVYIDNRKGAFKAVEYLIKLGHRKIIFINGSTKTVPGMMRLQGYIEALSKYNISFDKNLYYEGEFETEDGYEGITSILAEHEATAVFAGSDTIAIGVVSGLRSMGLSVPEDISVIGFDDIYMASMLNPPLTTIRQPSYEMGCEAVEIFVDIINNEGKKKNEKEFETELVIRNSCKAVS